MIIVEGGEGVQVRGGKKARCPLTFARQSPKEVYILGPSTGWFISRVRTYE